MLHKYCQNQTLYFGCP